MRTLRTLTSVAATAAALAIAAPTALAQTNQVGDATANPTTNVCAAMIDCTYINFHHGKPTDVVRHGGTVVSWTVNAGSSGGQVQLRILRPTSNHQFKVVRSSAVETISAPGLNLFITNLSVKRGDVLALSNDTSGIYMATVPAGTCVRFFDAPLNDGSAGKPNRVAVQLHLQLSADVQS